MAKEAPNRAVEKKAPAIGKVATLQYGTDGIRRRDAGLKPTDRKSRKTAARLRRLSLLVCGGQGLVGGAQQRRGFIQDNRNGNVAQQALEFPFVFEGMKKCAVLHLFEDFDGDAAGDVH